MDLINLPRLRMKELQTVGESTVRICNTIPEVQNEVNKVIKSLDKFVLGMQKDKAFKGAKAELDHRRDSLTYALFTAIKSESYYPHNGKIKQTVDALVAITNKYVGINRYRYAEQTAAVDNMIEEIRSLGLPPEELPTIQRWLPLIQEANEGFKTASAEQIKQSAKESSTSAASSVAPQLAEDLQNLYILMFAHARIGTNNMLIKAYKELAILVDTVN